MIYQRLLGYSPLDFRFLIVSLKGRLFYMGMERADNDAGERGKTCALV